MSCGCKGLNQIAVLNVPVQNGQLGTALDISGMEASKTIEISGNYSGVYSVYGSHDGTLYVPLLSFNAGVGGAQSIRQQIPFTTKFLKAKKQSRDTSAVTMSVSAKSACVCAGESLANFFLALATFTAGNQVGPKAAIDLWTLVPATGLDTGFTVMCGGPFEGLISIEGSLDGVHFTPLGVDADGKKGTGFTVPIAPRTPNTSFDARELSPIIVPDVVRYLRANLLLGNVYGPVTLTVGGKQNCDCDGGAGCEPVGIHDDGTSGTFTLFPDDSTPIILGTVPYDFSCTGEDNVQLDGTVDSRLIAFSGAGPLFPEYGIFVINGAVPPANQLWNTVFPDVDITTGEPPDLLYHTFVASNTIPNPGGPRTIVYAVRVNSIHSAVDPNDYQYKNYILTVTGV